MLVGVGGWVGGWLMSVVGGVGGRVVSVGWWLVVGLYGLVGWVDGWFV